MAAAILSRSKLRRKYRRFRRQSKKWCLVYALREGEDGPIRYVGQTRLDPVGRWRWHLKAIKKRKAQGRRLSRVQTWIDGLATPPTIKVLDEHGIWDITEAVWIDRLRRDGCALLNVLSVVA